MPLIYSERSKNRVKAIAVINQKGGVGKSTTAAAVGAGLILKGYRVLFIDLDAQGNISHTLRATPNSSGIMAMLQEPEIVRQTIEELPTAAITGSKERKGGRGDGGRTCFSVPTGPGAVAQADHHPEDGQVDGPDP